MAASVRTSEYLIALGSNVRHHRFGAPRKVIAAALNTLESHGLAVKRVSCVIETPPLGPSLRRYANAAVVVTARFEPPELLGVLKRIECRFGRRSGGQRWRARVLDLDIVLWSNGPWASPGLVIPHRAFRLRDFVLRPALDVAAGWRDPVSGLTVRQLHARLTRRRAIPR
jgi:2-amino-4-hydroxy-6-hydroxymethyldihydropteridine diphosphokinase